MRQKYHLNLWIVCVISIVLISGCVQQEAKENPTIAEIVSNPKLYEGKIVTINCKYGEYSCSGCETPEAMSGSTTCVYDETGCIYAFNPSSQLKERGVDLTKIDIWNEYFSLRAKVVLTKGATKEEIAILSPPSLE